MWALLFRDRNFKKAWIIKYNYLPRKITLSACAHEGQTSFPPSHLISACQVRASGSSSASVRTGTVSRALGRAWRQGDSPNPKPTEVHMCSCDNGSGRACDMHQPKVTPEALSWATWSHHVTWWTGLCAVTCRIHRHWNILDSQGWHTPKEGNHDELKNLPHIWPQCPRSWEGLKAPGQIIYKHSPSPGKKHWTGTSNLQKHMEATSKLQKVSPTFTAIPFLIFFLLVVVPFLILFATSRSGWRCGSHFSLREVLAAGNPFNGDPFGFWVLGFFV